MKQHITLSLIGITSGFLFVLLSAIRYYAVYFDEDRLIAYVSIGILIMCVAWLYERTAQLKNTTDAMEEYLAEQHD